MADTACPQPLQARLALGDQVMARQAVGAVAHGHARLGRQQHLVTAAFQDLPADLLGQPVGVDVGGVDQIDPGLQAPVDLPPGLLQVGRPDAGEPASAAEGHRAHGQDRDPEPGRTQLPIPHRSSRLVADCRRRCRARAAYASSRTRLPDGFVWGRPPPPTRSRGATGTTTGGPGSTPLALAAPSRAGTPATTGTAGPRISGCWPTWASAATGSRWSGAGSSPRRASLHRRPRPLPGHVRRLPELGLEPVVTFHHFTTPRWWPRPAAGRSRQPPTASPASVGGRPPTWATPWPAPAP